MAISMLSCYMDDRDHVDVIYGGVFTCTPLSDIAQTQAHPNLMAASPKEKTAEVV
jgi:hypothetical protein